MNGWNGLNTPAPFVGGMGGATNPMQNFNPNWLGGSGGYMTPAGGSEIMNPMTPMNLQPLNVGIPNIGAPSNGWFGINGLGKNLDTLKMGVGILGGAANIWSGLQQNKLAKESFNYQKGLSDTNLGNSIRSFNLQLDDKLRSRQVVEGTSDAAREEARARWAARDERKG